ncbi:MAG: hypothetical protein N2645_22595 [Clostridia bacterium]|nr:hypothetical protein [Clostridia bacterium]
MKYTLRPDFFESPRGILESRKPGSNAALPVLEVLTPTNQKG